MRHIVPGCSWSYTVIWISFNRIINITANCTRPFIHLFSPFSVGERLFLAQIEIFRKNKRSHIVNIEISAYLRALFLRKQRSIGRKCLFSDSLLDLPVKISLKECSFPISLDRQPTRLYDAGDENPYIPWKTSRLNGKIITGLMPIPLPMEPALPGVPQNSAVYENIAIIIQFIEDSATGEMYNHLDYLK